MRTIRDEIVGALRAGGCVFAEDEAALLIAETDDDAVLADMVRRRVAGEPLEHVLGWAQFDGLRIVVEPGVFVPRRRTEALVEHAARRTRTGAVALDLCCGSGAVGAALARRVDLAELHAADLDPAAVRCAGRNLAGLGTVYQGDLFDALPATLQGRIDIIVANVPYVPTAEIALLPSEAREHEDRVALDGGGDGLDVARRVVSRARYWLSDGGRLLFEVNARQADTALGSVTAAGLDGELADCDDWGTTIVFGQAAHTPTSR